MLLSYLKWTATVVLIIGGYVNAVGMVYGPLVLFVGGLIWTWASILMKEKSLIITNFAMAIVTIYGLSQNTAMLDALTSMN
jgi:hypothetical protein